MVLCSFLKYLAVGYGLLVLAFVVLLVVIRLRSRKTANYLGLADFEGQIVIDPENYRDLQAFGYSSELLAERHLRVTLNIIVEDSEIPALLIIDFTTKPEIPRSIVFDTEYSGLMISEQASILIAGELVRRAIPLLNKEWWGEKMYLQDQDWKNN